MMASISTEYYQFILSQGLCSGTGASMIFYPAMSCVITWFFKKRAFAMGIVAAGSGLGGIIFPIMVERLSSEVGYGWTMRICAFLILALTVIVNLTVVSRIPPAPRPVKIMDFIMPYKELRFSLLAFGSFLMFFGKLPRMRDLSCRRLTKICRPFPSIQLPDPRWRSSTCAEAHHRLPCAYTQCWQHIWAHHSQLRCRQAR